MKIITVAFFKSTAGTEPVKEWLLTLSKEDKRTLGEDLKTVEYGWPIGMPLVRKLDKGLWEVRSNISSGRIARVIFTVHEGYMVLLHGFIKKSQKTPKTDLDTSAARLRDLLSEVKNNGNK